jgi:hypothetical protein
MRTWSVSWKDAAGAFANVILAWQVGDVAGWIKALTALLEVRFLEVEAHGLATEPLSKGWPNLQVPGLRLD